MLELNHVSKRYQETVLKDINLTLPDHGMVVITGKSGCGKSTLLQIIGGLDTLYQGNVYFNGTEIRSIKHYIRKHVSFIFQQFHLIPWLNARENIALAWAFKGKTKKIMPDLDFLKKKMAHLSGGQKQRVACFRATLFPVSILLCDEPTGSLDQKHADEIFQMLKQISKEKLVIVVTHSKALASTYSDILIEMKEGRIVSKQGKKKSKRIVKQKTLKTRTSNIQFMKLVLLQMKSKWKRYTKMMMGISFAIFCILLTFSCSNSLQKQIKKQLYQLLPTNTITVSKKQNQSISKEDLLLLKQQDAIQFAYLEPEQYEFLGLSFHENYQEDQTLYIGDMTKSMTSVSLKKGKKPKKENEIVVSLSTAKHLTKGKDITSLLNRNIYGYYASEDKIISINLTITGITDQTTALDTLYSKEFSNLSWLEKEGQITGKVALLESSSLNNNTITNLKKQFSDYKFKQSVESFEKKIDGMLHQVQIILIGFSLLAIVSSCFLIGEVLFLSVVERVKEIGIFLSLGATKLQIAIMILLEAWIIISVSFVLSSMMMQGMIGWINNIIASELSILHFLSIDFSLFGMIYLCSILFGVLSSLFPAIYGANLNPMDCLNR